jgi:hypothetical protein
VGLWKLGLSELGKKSDDDDFGVLKFFFFSDEICIFYYLENFDLMGF